MILKIERKEARAISTRPIHPTSAPTLPPSRTNSSHDIAADRQASTWATLLRQHVVWRDTAIAPLPTATDQQTPGVHVTLPDPSRFEGRINSGQIGGLRYCHLHGRGYRFVNRSIRPRPTHCHTLILQLSGATVFRADGLRTQLTPGQMLLINRFKTLQVEQEGPSEQLVLFNPLGHSQHEPLTHEAVIACSTQRPMARMAFHWASQACLGDAWPHDIIDDLLQAFSTMLAQALRSDAKGAAQGVEPPSRAAIEAYLHQHLTDPDLDINQLAQHFGCSPRTLHRALKQDGGQESLERCLWRMRVQACADTLQQPDAHRQTLTDLALQFGFSSSAHFSTLFSKLMGVTPSRYRVQRQLHRDHTCTH